MKNEDSIRISVATLNRICIDDAYLLLLNKNRLKKGHKIYTPVGGAAKTTPVGKKYLEDGLEAVFENGDDLRFSIPKRYVADFEKWLDHSPEVERNPFRELKEELVVESGLLKSLSQDEVSFSYLGRYKMKGITNRVGQEGKETIRYFDVYDTSFSEEKLKEIKENIRENGLAALLTEEEIRRQKTKNGIPIGANALPLIELASHSWKYYK